MQLNRNVINLTAMNGLRFLGDLLSAVGISRLFTIIALIVSALLQISQYRFPVNLRHLLRLVYGSSYLLLLICTRMPNQFLMESKKSAAAAD